MANNQDRTTFRSKIKGFVDRSYKDHIGAYSAQAAYFLIMSFIPFILFLTTLIRYTSVTYNMIREAIVEVLPQNLQGFVMEIVADVYQRNSAVLPITAVTALWSAGKGLQAITNGLNTIYQVKETRNWLINRIYSVFYTLLFSVALIVTLTLMVLGEQLRLLVSEYNPIVGRLLTSFQGQKNGYVFLILFGVFLVLFRFLPNRKATFRSQVPGALLTAFSWMIFSYCFSLYFEMFPGFSDMYGNLTALIVAMLWIYFLMNLMLYGAEINIYFEKEFRRLAKVLRKRREIRAAEKERKRLEKEAIREQKAMRRRQRRTRRGPESDSEFPKAESTAASKPETIIEEAEPQERSLKEFDPQESEEDRNRQS